MKSWKGAGIIALCSLSLVGLGFSTWVFGTTDSQKVAVDVQADDVVLRTVGLEEAGIVVDTESFQSSLRYSTDTDGSSEGGNLLGPVYFTVQATVDPSKDIHFAGENYLKVTFGFVDGNGTQGADENLVSLRIYPANYEHFDFAATAKLLPGQTDFYFPIQSEERMSLYDLASLDSTYPRGEDDNVPVVFRFDLSNPNLDFLRSSTIKIVFGMSDSIA